MQRLAEGEPPLLASKRMQPRAESESELLRFQPIAAARQKRALDSRRQRLEMGE